MILVGRKLTSKGLIRSLNSRDDVRGIALVVLKKVIQLKRHGRNVQSYSRETAWGRRGQPYWGAEKKKPVKTAFEEDGFTEALTTIIR